MPRITSIHHLALTVSDAAASAAFYRELLGLQDAWQHDDETIHVRLLGGDGFLVGLRQYVEHEDSRFSEFRTGMDHVAFGVESRDDLAEFEERLTGMGATFTPTADSPFGPVIVFRDPDGIQGEIFLPETG